MMSLSNKSTNDTPKQTSSNSIPSATTSSTGFLGVFAHQSPFDEDLLDKGYPLTYSFAAAGWLQMYHFGVGRALQETGAVTPADDDKTRCCGTSAGSLAATGLVVGVDMNDLRDYSLECSRHCRSRFKHAFVLRDYVLNGVKKFPVAMIAEKPHLKEPLNSRLEVYATVLPSLKTKIFHNCFEDPEDLGEALAASCCLTPIAGFPFQLRKTGEWVCDGGVKAFQPRAGEPNVITVNPFYPFSNAHISPSAFIPMWWAIYPPDEATYAEVFDVGFNDAIHYLVQSGRVDKSYLNHLRPITRLTSKKQSLTSNSTIKGLVQVMWTKTSSLVKDLLLMFFFLCIFRPLAMMIIYSEIFLWGLLCLFLASFHEGKHLFWMSCDVLQNLIWPSQPAAATSDSDVDGENEPAAHTIPSSEDTTNGATTTTTTASQQRSSLRKRSNRRWRDVYQSARNLISFRTWAHLNFLGDHIPINRSRLQKSSRLYRFLRPMVYSQQQEAQEKRGGGDSFPQSSNLSHH